jgi:hypothetical protein
MDLLGCVDLHPFKILVGKPKGRNLLEYVGMETRIIFK